VLDFGLAKVHEAEVAQAGETATHLPADDLTGEGRIVGTIAYMSPEQAEGKPVDQRSDIFSLGVMLHEMATGDRPFKGDTGVSIISSIIKDTPPPVTDSRPDLPLPLARIIKRCLIKDPQRRYQSARDLHTDLEDLKQDVDSGVLSHPSGTRETDTQAKSFRVPKPVAYGAAAAVVALVGVLAAVTIARRLTAPHTFAPGAFQRLTDSGGVLSMALSADGRYVAFTQRDNGLTGLWILQTATGSKAQIVPSTDQTLSDASFSPDGNFVYYTSSAPTSRIPMLYKVSALGGDATRVLEDVSSNISFSPDGAQFSCRRGTSTETKTTLMIVRVDGSAPRLLATSEAPRIFDDMPAPWSPDGRTIVAIESSLTFADRARLAAVDVASGRLTSFGGDWVDLEGVAWMPDGRSLIVAAADALPPAHIHLWQVTWPDGKREQLTFGLNDYNNVAVSADGRTVAAIEDEYNSSIWVQPLVGGTGRQVTPNSRDSVQDGIAWTPDGRLVYSAFTGGSVPQLWMMDADGSHPKRLTPMLAMTPAVSPDGQWIYFAGGATPSATSIWKLALDGRDPRGDPIPLTKGTTDLGPIVSADGKAIFYASRDGALIRTMKVSSDGGEATPLTDPRPGFAPLLLAPDGSHLVGFATNPATRRRQPVMLSVNGGPLEFMNNVPANGLPITDGTGWVFTATRDGVRGLFLKPLTGGPDRLLADLGGSYVTGLAVSFDSRTLGFIRGRNTSDVVLIKAK